MRRFTLSAIVGLSLLTVACTKTGDSTTDDTEDTAVEVEEVVQDADGDGILDAHEGEEDADGDGEPNYLDLDSDGDGLLDSAESGDGNLQTYPFDSDIDGVPDFLDLDSDDNGVLDQVESGSKPKVGVDTDDDGVPDYRDFDNDGDAITDVWEITNVGSPVDTDLDGQPDYMDIDSDADTLCDMWEGGTTEFREEPIDSDGDGDYDFRDLDSDDDGFTDREEGKASGTCGMPSDIDGDGSWDSADTDADGDGITDRNEVDIYGTDPYDADSDGDGQTDGAELAAGTDPLDAESIIEGVYVVVQERTSTEEIFTFEPRIQYGDVAFLVDTTCSMSSTALATASRFAEIVAELDSTFENVAFGLAQFDDYNYGSMGSGADKPFKLLQQITTSESDMQSELNNIQIHNGSDGQESTVEALYQGITGAGYDQNCNGSYDATPDVLPFIADSADPFGGSAGDVYDSSVTGTGSYGGFGFREYSLPILVYATDIYIRDPDYTGSTPGLTAVPGGCPQDVGHNQMYTALADLGGYIIGLDVGSYGSTSQYSPYSQMIDFANDTGSLADMDGDGEIDDPLVFEIPQAGGSFSTELKEGIVNAVDQLVSSVAFEKISLEVVGDTYGMIDSIDPEYYEGIDWSGVEGLDYTLNFTATVPATDEDQLFTMTLRIVGDDTILLDELDIVVVIPGTDG